MGPSLFAKSGHSLDGLLGYTNSRVFQRIVDVSLQGLHYNNGVIGSRPYVPPTHVEKVRALERELVAISRRDWDAYEGSGEFPGHPCATAEARKLDNLAAAWNEWAQAKSADVRAMLALEESNNQFFIDAYGLSEEISPTVSEEHITLARPDRAKDAQRFVSYAIGCMMGRYSLDEPGLIYAHAGGEGFDATRYASFAADAETVRRCLEYALETRRRVKEQLKKIGGMEFYDVHFSYIDLEDMQERFISVPEQTGGGIISEGRLQPGVLHTIAMAEAEIPGVYRMEVQALSGSGKLSISGSLSREHVRVAFDYFKANASRVSASIRPTERDFHLHLVELQNAGAPDAVTLASFIAFASAALAKPLQPQLAVMGDMTLGGTIAQARNLAESLQVAFDAGAKRILLPMFSVTDIPTVPGELFAKFQTSFYSDPVDAVFKALGVE